MFALYSRGLNGDIIFEEMEFQDSKNEQIWEAFMAVKLEELEKRFDITVPFKRKVRKLAERKIEEKIGGNTQSHI